MIKQFVLLEAAPNVSLTLAAVGAHRHKHVILVTLVVRVMALSACLVGLQIFLDNLHRPSNALVCLASSTIILFTYTICGIACSAIPSCVQCTHTTGCGWCSNTSKCVEVTGTAGNCTPVGTCRTSLFARSIHFHSLDQACQDYTQCYQCIAQPSCTYCSKTLHCDNAGTTSCNGGPQTHTCGALDQLLFCCATK